MEAALFHLGRLDVNERVRRYVADQRRQMDQENLHDMLGLRKARRKAPDPDMYASPCFGANGVSTGSIDPARATVCRRRPLDENARRAESKLGRAANLRPGRITITTLETILAQNPHKKTRNKDASRFEPTSNDSNDNRNTHADHGPSTGAVPRNRNESSWDSDEHSIHSNLMHYDGQHLKRTQRSDPQQERTEVPTQFQEEVVWQKNAAEKALFDDFYKRNPAALANGWLALRHHRDLPARGDEGAITDRVAKAMVRSRRPPLLGLHPTFKLRTRVKGRD
ncbi:uncharacterized protein MEPE_05529 [Melanopsichium pennsylvanicum]|uniref:Uncharacterized protein n=2 Tax=Melanopsichium pennsylvanicum TaxID=63383 RepID=A0AAJ5C7E4_9BASI|nr:uncharacterized protein BN887_04033 [Melanopsichium pennsylvanicum 4]SNX86820.1 uncharacterized protein MEPE_05529 [Melanopsichium pennsylvanicum]